MLISEPCLLQNHFLCLEAWAPAGMGKRGHLPPPSGNVVKCFCALVVTTKRPVDELFMHYFHNLSSASGDKGAQTPTGALSLDLWGTSVLRPLICPPLKKSCGRLCLEVEVTKNSSQDILIIYTHHIPVQLSWQWELTYFMHNVYNGNSIDTLQWNVNIV